MYFNKLIFCALSIIVAIISTNIANAQGSFLVSCDIYSQYVWRGTQFGTGPSIQPGIAYTSGPFTMGAWSAWQHGGDGSENDLYATYSMGDYSFTITDYYFPGPPPSGDFTEVATDTGAHNIEFSLGGSFGGIGLTTGVFVVEPGFYSAFDVGKIPFSKYIGLTYGPFMLGFGDGGYTIDGGFAPIEVGVTASNEKYNCSWILNPDSGMAFLVVGISL